MTELTLSGVRDDQVLVMHDDAGNEFTLQANEELFTHVRKIRAHSAHATSGKGPVRPKVIQAMIRSGMTAQDVVEATGEELVHVQRYEGPILAERRHIAQQAGLAPVYPAHDHSQAPRPMAEVALERLALREVDPKTIEWDAWRTETGSWHVELKFEAAGRGRVATWEYLRGSINPLDDEARWLSDVGPTDSGPIPNYGSASERVFNIEAETQPVRESRDHQTETGRILESLRRRRSHETQDTLPHQLHPVPSAPSVEPDGAHTALGRPADATDDSVFALPKEEGNNTEQDAVPTWASASKSNEQRSQQTAANTASVSPIAKHSTHDFPDQPSLLDEPGVAEGSEDFSAEEPPAFLNQPHPEAAQSAQDQQFPTPAAPAVEDDAMRSVDKDDPTKSDTESKKKGRSSVPSWDEIMFGTRRDS